MYWILPASWLQVRLVCATIEHSWSLEPFTFCPHLLSLTYRPCSLMTEIWCLEDKTIPLTPSAEMDSKFPLKIHVFCHKKKSSGQHGRRLLPRVGILSWSRGHPLPQKHHTMGFKQDAGGGKLWSLAVSTILRLILTNQDAALTDDGSLT